MTGPEVTSVVGGRLYTDQNHKVKTTYYDEDRRSSDGSARIFESGRRLKAQNTNDERRTGRVIKTESK
ncbi:MAG: hypothetical protein KIT57_16825 [Blastocatellales bacterium]|nr:hypothetical protein [Blastocatellales bacterium]